MWACDSVVLNEEMVSFRDHHPSGAASPEDLKVQKETCTREEKLKEKKNSRETQEKLKSKWCGHFDTSHDSRQEEKPRRLFRPVRGVDLKIAWQIHAREMRRCQIRSDPGSLGGWKSPTMSYLYRSCGAGFGCEILGAGILGFLVNFPRNFIDCSSYFRRNSTFVSNFWIFWPIGMRWHEECWVRWRNASDYAPLIPQSLCLSLGTRGWSRFLQGGLVALCLFKDGRLHQHVPQPEQIGIQVAQAWSNMKLLIGAWSAHGLVRWVDREICCRKKDEESEENRQNMAKQVNQKQSVDYTVHHAQTHPFDQIPLLIGMGTSIVAEPALKCSERPEWAEGSCLFPKHRRAHLRCDAGCGGNVLWCGLLLGIPRACHFSALQSSHWEARWGKHCWHPDLATVYSPSLADSRLDYLICLYDCLHLGSHQGSVQLDWLPAA